MSRRAWTWLRMVAGAGIIGVLAWRLGTGAFVDALRVVRVETALLALAIGGVTTVFSAWRWHLVARGLGLRLPLAPAVGDYYQALFFNAALPGGVLGDVDRALRHGRDAGDVSRGVRAVVLERGAGQLALALVGIVVLSAYPALLLGTGLGPVALVLLGVGAVALGLAARHRRRPTGSRWSRAWHAAASDLRHGLLGRRVWPGVVIASAVVLAGHIATFVIAARAAGVTGASAPVGRLIPLAVLALVAMAVPVNIGGFGPREGVAAWAFGAVGLGASLGVTTAVVYGLLALVASLPGAGVLVVRWVSRPRAPRAARDSGEPLAEAGLEPARQWVSSSV